VEGRNRKEVHDFSILVIPVISISGGVVSLTAAHGLGILSDIVAVDLPVASSSVKSVNVAAAPFQSQLYFSSALLSSEYIVIRVPEVDGVVVRGRGHEFEVTVGHLAVVCCDE